MSTAHRRSTSAARCRPASPCSRRAPAPARRTRSPRSRRATSPRACRSSSCCSSRSRAWRPASCASASASASSRPRRGWHGVLAGGRPPAATRSCGCSPTGRATRSSAPRPPRRARSPTSTRRRSPRRTASARRSLGGLGVAGDVERDMTVRRGRRRPARGGRRRPLRPPLPRDATAAVHAGAGAADRARRGRQPDGADRARERAPRTRDAGDARAGSRARCATELEARKRRGGRPDLRRPAHPAARPRSPGPDRRGGRAQRLRERYRVVLVDEFQDTDPVQWEIMRARVRRPATGRSSSSATPSRRSTPSAAPTSTPTSTRRERRRRGRRSTSTGAATRACSTPTTRCSAAPQLGHEGIVYRTVRRGAANQAPRLHGRAGQRAAAHPRRCRRDDVVR